MAKDPNSPSYIVEESYPHRYISNGFLQEQIDLDSKLIRQGSLNIVDEINNSGEWVFGVRNLPSEYYSDTSKFNSCMITDINSDIKLLTKLPAETGNNAIENYNHTVRLTYNPSTKTINSSNANLLNNFVLDFWFKIPTFNTAFLTIPGWFEYAYNENGNGLYYSLDTTREKFSISNLDIGITDYFGGTKRLICDIRRTVNPSNWTPPSTLSLGRKDMIFFIDNNIPIVPGEWHHLVIKNNGIDDNYSMHIPNYSSTKPIENFFIWFDDVEVLKIKDCFFDHGGRSDKLYDLQLTNISSSPHYSFYFSNSWEEWNDGQGDTTHWWHSQRKFNILDLNSEENQKFYFFNTNHFDSFTNLCTTTPGDALFTYGDLYDTTNLSQSEEICLKNIKYSTIKNTVVSNKNFDQELLNPIEIQVKEDLKLDIIDPISIYIPQELTPVDILDPIEIQVSEDYASDFLYPVIISIPQAFPPTDLLNIDITTWTNLKPLEEVEEYINKTYLGSQQAAEDFQLLFKVTDTSYWPVEYTIDSDYHIHIKRDPMYIGVDLYACTNKQFLYCKYDMMNV